MLPADDGAIQTKIEEFMDCVTELKLAEIRQIKRG
jgi:hypothetical protein